MTLEEAVAYLKKAERNYLNSKVLSSEESAHYKEIVRDHYTVARQLVMELVKQQSASEETD